LSEREREVLTTDLKTLILSKLEKLIFEVAWLMYQKRGREALELLNTLFPLLPSDVRRDLAEEEQKTEEILHHIKKATARITDPFTQTVRRDELANRHLKFIRDTTGKIQSMLTDRYLRIGFKGLDITKETEDITFEEE